MLTRISFIVKKNFEELNCKDNMNASLSLAAYGEAWVGTEYGRLWFNMVYQGFSKFNVVLSCFV